MPLLRLLLTLAFLLGSAATAAEGLVVPLWPAGHSAREGEPEKVNGSNISNIHRPTLTVYLPEPAQTTGCAVIVAPGGGHARLAIQHEGHAVAQWLANHGVAAFVLKYRLAKDDATPAGAPQPYTVDGEALADAQRALQLVRARAAEWKVRPDAVGILGFSAGGEVALLTATRGRDAQPAATDPLERQSARANFVALLYPGRLTRTDIVVGPGMPTAFLAAGYGDRQDISEGLAELYLKCKRAGVSAELHMYAGAGHGFGLRDTNHSPAGAWPARLHEWLADRKFLGAP